MCSTGAKIMWVRISSGTSSRSPWFSRGRITVLIPARWAPSTFSFTPPILSTRPRSVISPVIAIPARALRRVSRLTIAVTSVTPAEGPSFGIAPEGRWMWMSVWS